MDKKKIYQSVSMQLVFYEEDIVMASVDKDIFEDEQPWFNN